VAVAVAVDVGAGLVGFVFEQLIAIESTNKNEKIVKSAFFMEVSSLV